MLGLAPRLPDVRPNYIEQKTRLDFGAEKSYDAPVSPSKSFTHDLFHSNPFCHFLNRNIVIFKIWTSLFIIKYLRPDWQTNFWYRIIQFMLHFLHVLFCGNLPGNKTGNLLLSFL